MTPDTRAIAELLSVEDIYQPDSDICKDAFGDFTPASKTRFRNARLNIRKMGVAVLSRGKKEKDDDGLFEYCIAAKDWDMMQLLLKEKNIEHNPSSPEEVEE